jgi:hypothetical protein
MTGRQWRKANPSFPHRTGEGAILRMRKLLGSVESFQAVRALGIWDERQQWAVRRSGLGLWGKRVAEPPESRVSARLG